MGAEAVPAPDHQPKAKIFISYSRKDMDFADRLGFVVLGIIAASIWHEG